MLLADVVHVFLKDASLSWGKFNWSICEQLVALVFEHGFGVAVGSDPLFNVVFVFVHLTLFGFLCLLESILFLSESLLLSSLLSFALKLLKSISVLLGFVVLVISVGENSFNFWADFVKSSLLFIDQLLVLLSQGFEFFVDLLLSLFVLLVQLVNSCLMFVFNSSIFNFLISNGLSNCLGLLSEILSFTENCVSFSSESFELTVLLILESLELFSVSLSFSFISDGKSIKSFLFLLVLLLLDSLLLVSLKLESISLSLVIQLILLSDQSILMVLNLHILELLKIGSSVVLVFLLPHISDLESFFSFSVELSSPELKVVVDNGLDKSVVLLTVLDLTRNELRGFGQTFPFVDSLEESEVGVHDSWCGTVTRLTLDEDTAVLVVDQVIESLGSLEDTLVVLLAVHVNWAVSDVLNTFSSKFTLLMSPVDASVSHLLVSHQVKHGSDLVRVQMVHIMNVSEIWSNPKILVLNLGNIEAWDVVSVTLLNMSINDINVAGIILTRVLLILASVGRWIHDSQLSGVGSLNVLSSDVTDAVVVGEEDLLVDGGLFFLRQFNCSLEWSHVGAKLVVHPFVCV